MSAARRCSRPTAARARARCRRAAPRGPRPRARAPGRWRAARRPARAGRRARGPSWRSCGRTRSATTCASSMPPRPRAPACPTCALQVPERTLTTWLVLDVSPSMAFGTAERLKADVAEGVAIAVARLATRRGGRAALLRSGAGDDRLLPPRGGRHAQVAVERALSEGVARTARGRTGAASPARSPPRSSGSGASPAGRAWSSSCRTSATTGWRAPARRAGRPPRVLAVEIRDPREAELPHAGQLALVDPETGALRRGRHVRARAARALRRARGRAPRSAWPPTLRARRRRARRAAHRSRLAARPGRGLDVRRSSGAA